MFKRVSSHLKSLATPFLSDITGTINGLVQGNNTISGQQGKVAAQLLKKSPFEKLDSPMEALKRDPLGFSQVQYPVDLTSNELGHYILFYTLQNKFTQGGRNGISDLDMAARVGLADYDSNADFSSKTLKTLRQTNTPQVKLDNSVLSKFPSHQTVTSAIALYMPPGVKVSYKNSYEAEATELSGDIAKTLGNVKGATSTSEQLKAIGQGAISGLGQFGKNFIGEAISMVGAGDPVKLLSKALGVAVNPQQEQFYVGPDFRSFSYSFDFWPRSQKELDAANNIILLFKYHSHPDLELSKSGGRMFFVPSEFEIHYLHMGKQNEYLNKISKCVCTSVDVDYGPEGEFKTFVADGRGAAPVHYKLTLGFTELELMTKQKIYDGH
jgi:hypothetical protein